MESTAITRLPALKKRLRDTKPDQAKKRGPYDSDLMLERRRKAIDATKRLIAERGAYGFTIRELTDLADVSLTFIYSAYGDKEGLVAAAIQDFYLALPVAQRRSPTTLTGLLGDIDEATAVILANAAYSRALADLYFSRTADPRPYAIVRQMAVDTFLPWLEMIAKNGATVPGLTLDTMCSILANDRWTGIFDWARSRIPDERLAAATKISFLVTASGLTFGPVRDRLDKTLWKLLHTSGPGGALAHQTKRK